MSDSASSASGYTQPSFWESEILEMFFPQTPTRSAIATDADVLRELHFIPGLKELMMTRQVHALEHATVWVLSSLTSATRDNSALSGLSTERGFYLYGDVATEDVSRAVQTALRRITTGEAELAVHPRCGTNLSVGMMLTAGLAIGASVLLPRDPIGQVIGLGAAAMTAAYLTPELGPLVQQYVTTAIPFNLAIANISPLRDQLGRPTHFIEVRWVD